MSRQVSMFAPEPREVRETAVPAAAPPPVEPPKDEPRRFGRDVKRVVVHKAGVFRRVREGKPVDEYFVLELHNGNVVEETLGGERRPSPVTRELIETSLTTGMWKEIDEHLR